ncbi:alpha/beta hydrolase [Sphingomonas sp. SFZ2018-12]|uniref:alpha/beta hydrolase n=1 Tax=Sphingomonas sp. SFZ2018-12 TaxID=2683197 RepID=UPI001F0E0B6E
MRREAVAADMDTLDPQSRALLRAYDAMKQEWLPRVVEQGMAGSRAFADAVFAAFRGADRDLRPERVVDLTVPGGAGDRPARLYRPAAPDGADPGVVLFLHGGGWSLGGIDAYDGLTASLAALSGVAVLSLDYRLAPEHPFPAGLSDAMAATGFLMGSAATIGCDPARVAVMGDSAGGNLAAVVAREIAQAGVGGLRAQYLVYPMTDVTADHADYASRRDFGAGDYFLANAGIDFARDVYLTGTPARPDDPRVSPLIGDIPADLAPAMIVTAGHDPLCDEAHAYHLRLIEAGVASRYECIESTIHAFLSFGILDCAQAMRRELAQAMGQAMRII